MSLCGLTHKQAVQCLKGSGQVSATLLVTGEPASLQRFLATSEAAAALGARRVGQKQMTLSASVCFFLLSHLPFSSTFPGGVKVRRKQADVPRQGSLPPVGSPGKS